MSSRPTVMISSTARDLPEHRDEVRLGCHRAGFASDQMMENLTALDKDAVETSLKMVEDADIYLGIFAYRYGYVPEGSDISITEMEYNKAVDLDKPRLIFFIHEDHPVTGKDFEHGEANAKLQAFKERVGRERVAAFFKSPGDLRGHVVEALIELKKALEGDQNLAPKEAARRLHRRTLIPVPPKPYIAHPYTLSQTEDLVGRRDELNALTDWVAKPGSPAYGNAIFCFVAIGGMGKSALTWKWFNDIAPEEMPELAGRLWWSFYESDDHFESFLNRALCYIGELDEDDVRNMPWHDREALLLQHLNDKPFLLVLDGLERILLAYNRMDASSLADGEYDEKTASVAAGAAGLRDSAAQSFPGQHRLREAVDRHADRFLKKLQQSRSSKILVSSRVFPQALESEIAKPSPGSYRFDLKGLHDDDAAELASSLGLSSSVKEVSERFNDFDNHPLAIQFLAGEVARFRPDPGNFSAWRAANPNLFSGEMSHRELLSEIIGCVLEEISVSANQILLAIAAVRRPIEFEHLSNIYDARKPKIVKVFENFIKRSCGPDSLEIDRDLFELEDRGLINWTRSTNCYDAHPVVRSIVWSIAPEEKKTNALKSIKRNFQIRRNLINGDNITSIEEFKPTLIYYEALLHLGLFDEAFDIFEDEIDEVSYFRLAVHRHRINWIEGLFPRGLKESSELTFDEDQAYAFGALARSYRAAGSPLVAASLFLREAQLLGDCDYCPGRQTPLGNCSTCFIDGGKLHEATRLLKITLSKNRSNVEETETAVRLQHIGRVLSLVGNSDLGQQALVRGQKIPARYMDGRQMEGVAFAFLAEAGLHLGNTDAARILSERAWQYASQMEVKQDFVRAAIYQGRSGISSGNWEYAEEKLDYALVNARQVDLVGFELPALIAIAELELARGNLKAACERLDEIWEPAEKGPYPLYQADAYNVLADICIAENDKPGAIEAATKAYGAAWCDGPPWAYHWGLEKAKAHLYVLGAPKPYMSPFDESKFDPMPEVEINPQDEYWVDPSVPLEILLDLP